MLILPTVVVFFLLRTDNFRRGPRGFCVRPGLLFFHYLSLCVLRAVMTL